MRVFGGDFGGGLWTAFIGWFLENTASMQILQVTFQSLLKGHTVAQAMSETPPAVPADSTLQQLVDEHILGAGRRSFKDSQGDQVLGLMTVHRVKEVPRNEWGRTTAAQAMLPMEKLKHTTPETGLWSALQQMDRAGVNQLPVTQNSHVVGCLLAKMSSVFCRHCKNLAHDRGRLQAQRPSLTIEQCRPGHWRRRQSAVIV